MSGPIVLLKNKLISIVPELECKTVAHWKVSSFLGVNREGEGRLDLFFHCPLRFFGVDQSLIALKSKAEQSGFWNSFSLGVVEERQVAR